MRRKPDALEIESFIDQLVHAWEGDTRKWWPQGVYHVTDVQNAASVITTGRLLSRNRAVKEGLLRVDSASPGHIAGTSQDVLDCVRLYWRPRTETFKVNEGIRSASQLVHRSHCPVPIIFMFDSKQLLGTVGVGFSDGNLRRHRKRILYDSHSLQSMDFEAIYRDVPLGSPRLSEHLSTETKAQIKNYRQAEVTVPDELPLEPFLTAIIVRSDAEEETLMALVSQILGDVPQWLTECVIVDPTAEEPTSAFFFRKHAFVDRVVLRGDNLRIEFYRRYPGYPNFEALLELAPSNNPESVYRSVRVVSARDETDWPIDSSLRGSELRATLRLDGCLAYQNFFRA